jgi:hypothetical protein
LLGLAFAQEWVSPLEHLDDAGRLPGSKIKCIGEVPKDFACAIFWDIDPPFGISVIGGESNFPPPVIREVSLILDGTLYTAVYDPPMKWDEKISGLRRNVGIPARVDGDNLFVKCPGGKEVKAKIIRREKINPNRPQPA